MPYNHADAIGLTKADTAILLGPGGGIFSRLVAAIFTEGMEAEGGWADGAADRSNVITAAELSHQLVELLAMLETRGRPANLRSFMEGEGHRELIEWSRAVIDKLVRVQAATLKEELIAELKTNLDTGAFPRRRVIKVSSKPPRSSLPRSPSWKRPSRLPVLGLAFASYPFLRAAAQAHDLADTEFTGPKWPFRYAWGTGARYGRHAELLDLLDA